MDEGAAPRTVGVEEEFLFVDPAGVPQPMSREVLADAAIQRDPDADPARDGVAKELHQEQVETGTRPRTDLGRLRADLVARRRALAAAAARHGVQVAATATSPLPVEPTPSGDPRYRRIMTEYGATALEQLACGCHVHVAIASRAEGVAAINAIQPWLSVLLALSANSPYWQGEDTGYASYRRMVWGRWPGSGPVAAFTGPQEYDRTVSALVESGVLLDEGMVYFDVRLSARYPTLEIRVADVCTDPDDAILIAALCRALVDSAVAPGASPWPVARVELLRGAAWRAARSGLDGDLVDPLSGRAVAAPTRLQHLVDRVSPALRRNGDLDVVEQSLQRLLGSGTGATRQRAARTASGGLADVVRDVVRRTATG